MNPCIRLLSVFAFLVLAQSASAQIVVGLQPARKVYVAHEPVEATVTIVNRTGRDIVLRGPGAQSSWLTLDVTDGRGHLISPFRGRELSPVIIPNGERYDRRIAVNQMYPMEDLGQYRLKANVYFPQLGRYFNSAPVSIQISDGRPIWEQIVGIPEGRPNAGDFHRYTLLTFNAEGAKHLYIRVQDEQRGTILSTWSIGPVITVRPPEAVIDRENRLHILHMGAPRTWGHTVVDVDGTFISRDVYREQGASRPGFATGAEGDVVIVGGVSEAEAAESSMEDGIRRLSERPDGLPDPERLQQGTP